MLSKLEKNSRSLGIPVDPASSFAARRCAADAAPSSYDCMASRLQEGRGSSGVFRGGCGSRRWRKARLKPKESDSSRWRGSMTLPSGVLWVLLAFFVGGCAGLPTDYPRPRSEAIHDTDNTRIGREVAPLSVVQPGKSGFFTLGNGLDAFVARLALAEAADRTLDVQYYLFLSLIHI